MQCSSLTLNMQVRKTIFRCLECKLYNSRIEYVGGNTRREVKCYVMKRTDIIRDKLRNPVSNRDKVKLVFRCTLSLSDKSRVRLSTVAYRFGFNCTTS